MSKAGAIFVSIGALCYVLSIVPVLGPTSILLTICSVGYALYAAIEVLGSAFGED